jgi:ABC-2 type transport system ATP-binding protein
VRSTDYTRRSLGPAWLHVEGLTKSYGRVSALAAVSFSVRQGEILGLIGPNGAGKTTLFECLAGVLPADAGQVSRNGARLSPRDRTSLLFYLPDAIAPWPSETVGWALEFTIGFFGGIRARRDDAIERLQLAPLLGKPIGTLSKGQRKRALLAVGLLMPQPLLLADEPFEGLDLRQTREVAAVLRDHAASGRTLFLSIHQIAEAARVCERFVLLSNGRIGGEGTVQELRSHAAALGGSAPAGGLEEVVLALT